MENDKLQGFLTKFHIHALAERWNVSGSLIWNAQLVWRIRDTIAENKTKAFASVGRNEEMLIPIQTERGTLNERNGTINFIQGWT